MASKEQLKEAATDMYNMFNCFMELTGGNMALSLNLLTAWLRSMMNNEPTPLNILWER